MHSGVGTGTKGEKSRLDLMAIAIDCFARFGFQGSSVDRIARMAGVTKGAIYYHFRDKEDLLAAAVADRIAAFETRVQRACEGVDADQALRRIAEVCVEHAESNEHPRFIITLMVEAIDTNETISTQLRDMMRRFRGFLRNLIKDAQERGVFRADRDARAVAAGLRQLDPRRRGPVLPRSGTLRFSRGDGDLPRADDLRSRAPYDERGRTSRRRAAALTDVMHRASTLRGRRK
jgi:AcrR family transcriptional regulator